MNNYLAVPSREPRWRVYRYDAAQPAAALTHSDASYYTEDLPIAAYQPVITNVLQPLEHAGEPRGKGAMVTSQTASCASG